MIFKTEAGEIEYRLPNVKEVLGLMRIAAKYQTNQTVDSNIELLEFMIDELKKYVVKVDYPNAKSYDELLNSFEYAQDIIALVTEFLNCLQIDQKKRI